jgi:hypothetical protein
MDIPFLIFLKENRNKARLALYHFSFKSIKSGLSMKSKRLQRPRGRVFFVTCSNLGQISPYNFKHLYSHFSQNFNQKFIPFLWNFLRQFWNLLEIYVRVGIFTWRAYKFLLIFFGCTHKYSTARREAAGDEAAAYL